MKDLLRREWQKAKKQARAQSRIRALALLGRRLFHLTTSYARGRFYFRQAQWKGRLVFAKGRPAVFQQGKMKLGNLVRIWSNINPTQLIIGKEGVLSIEDGVYINGALIAVQKEVRIGKNCYLAPMVQILDNDEFGLGEEAATDSEAVIIEEDAWLATRALITKGVRIGKGAVVAVGAVVTEDVAPYTLVAGIPAKPIRHLRAIQ